ncbi:MAG: ABC transporter ATP-binding protein [Acidimicrobiia bacterium]
MTVEDLVHAYRRRDQPVLRGINHDFPAGSVTAVMGPSGSGKTTLLSICGLLLRPQTGRVHYDDRPVTLNEAAMLRATRLAWVFQTANLIGRRTALDNVAVPMLLRGLDHPGARAHAADALERIHLAHLGDHRASTLSSGEAQRVCVARALVVEPDLLLADEPTGHLDRQSSTRVVEALLELHTGKTTVILATHDPEVAGRCERIVNLQGGRLVAA